MGKIKSVPNKRQSNIELLRIIAMLMIIAHHVAVHSGFGFSSQDVTVNRLWIQFIQMGGKIGVDIFVLISGYFLVTSPKLNHKKTVKLWLQIVSYSASLYIIALLVFNESISVNGVLKNFMPITYSKWWFAGTYFILFLLSPFINKALNSISKNDYRKLLLLLIVCWCIIPSAIKQSVQMNPLLWFVLLYALAGYIRLHVDTKKYNSKYCILAAAIIILLNYSLTVLFDFWGKTDEFYATYSTYFYEMNMLPILAVSVLLLLGFLNLNLGCNSLINIVSSATFGVYLIHENNYIRPRLWGTIFNNSAYADSSFLIPYTVLQIVVVFIACTLIELIRIYCVERLYVGIIDRFLSTVKRCTKKIFSLKIFCKAEKYL